MCSAYLWKGTLEGKHVARLAWDTVTTPKDEGGLGLKNLNTYNRTCVLKLLWLLLFRTESIWSAWMHDNVIKDRNFWFLQEKQAQTWIFKQLLKQRSVASQLIRTNPGNGRDCSFWYSPWTSLGPLLGYMGQSGPRQIGIPLNATMASVWRLDHWHLPPARSLAAVTLQIELTTHSITDEEPSISWIVEGTESQRFNTSQMFHLLRDRRPTVP